MPQDQLPSNPSAGGEGILGMLQGAPEVSNKDIQEALSPTLSGVPTQMPAYFTEPRKQMLPPAQMDRTPVIGAGNARAQGIGNAISASVRAVSNYVAHRDQTKQLAEATRVQQLLTAQAGVDQAQQVLQSDPNNAAAKESLTHNQAIVQGLFQDPKFVNTVQKGFQISLTDPSQNKTEHHSIVQQGLNLFRKQTQQAFSQQQAQQMYQKWEGSLPKELAPNQFAMARLQMQMQQRQDYYQVLKSVLPAVIRGKAMTDAKTIEGINNLQKQQAANQEWDRRNNIVQTQLYARLDYQQRQRFAALDHENALMIQRERTRMKDEASDPSKVLKASDESGRSWANAIAGMQTQLDQAKQALVTYQANKNADPTALAQMQADVQIRTNELERARRQASYYKSIYQVLGAKAGLADQPSESDSTGGANATADQSGATGASSDNFNINNLSDWGSYSDTSQKP